MKTKFQANAVYQTCLLLVCSFPKFCMPLNVGVASGSWTLKPRQIIWQAMPKIVCPSAENKIEDDRKAEEQYEDFSQRKRWGSLCMSESSWQLTAEYVISLCEV